MVVAVSAWWGLITALIGLAGVLVGGAITWAREAWVARANEEADVLTAARLLSDELMLIAFQIQVIIDELVQFRSDEFKKRIEAATPSIVIDEHGHEYYGIPEPQHIWMRVGKLVEEAPTNLWLAHQPPLARVLSGDDWRSVRRVYTLISIFRVYPSDPQPVLDLVRQRAMLIELNQQIRAALAVLDKYTGEQESHSEAMNLAALHLQADDRSTQDEGVTSE